MQIIESNLKFINSIKRYDLPSIIIIHHSAHKDATIFDIHRWHLKKGWYGCGYHFFITKDGKVYRGRQENIIGSHCKGHNDLSIGICLQGNFNIENVSNIQKNVLYDLCLYLNEKYNIKDIKGHKELINTTCPGDNFRINQIIDCNPVIDTYTIKIGDTLYSISKTFNTSVSNLKHLNGLTGNLIYPNQILRVL